MQQRASVNNSWSCGLDILGYDVLLESGMLGRSALKALREDLEKLRGEKVAILAPGLMAVAVEAVLPGVPAYGTKDCPADYDRYVVCCSPFVYHEIHCAAPGLGIEHDRLVYPFAVDVLEDTIEAKSAIDLDGWNALADKYAHRHTHGNALTKYFDLDVYLGVAMKYAWDAGLHVSSPRAVLDLGTGGCLFPFICSRYGHSAYGLDRSREYVPDFFVDIAELLGVTVFYSDMGTPFTGFGTSGFVTEAADPGSVSAPKYGGRDNERVRFDCVTSFATGFSEGWTSRDFQHFFNALRWVSGSKGVRFYSQPNPSGLMASEVLPSLLNVGAEVRECRIRHGFLTLLDIRLTK